MAMIDEVKSFAAMAPTEGIVGFDGQKPSDVEGMRVLSLNQIITFSQYIRKVLPLDGFVFWLKTQETQVKGSLHTSAIRQQLEDENSSINNVIFSTGTPVQDFDSIGPTELWIGEFQDLRFAFSQQRDFYQAAGLYHYVGQAINKPMQTQILEVGEEPLDDTLIVSNSLPAWLAIREYRPLWLLPDNPDIELFPSFALPANVLPPYGAVHIEPNLTRPFQAFPSLGKRMRHDQLAADHVRLTFYGLNNSKIMDFYETFIRYSEDTNLIGMMSMPIVRDEKRTQVEFGILGMKKTIEVDVSYKQSAMRDLARQQIVKATPLFIPTNFVVPVP